MLTSIKDSTMLSRTRIVTLAAVAAALAVPGGASAAIEASPVIGTPCSELKNTSSSYHVRLCGVTDTDQFRMGLLSNGSAHCGPTSLYNVLQYVARHVGAPLQDGLGDKVAEYDPADPGHYHNVTDRLASLTQLTGWLEDGGTTAAGNRKAYTTMGSSSDNTGWSYATGAVDSSNTAEFGHELAKRLVRAPAQLWYGRYVEYPDGTMRRDGGHAVTVVSAKGSVGSGEVELTLMDPGRAADHKVGNYLYTQSAYRLETVKLKKVQFTQRWVDKEANTVSISKSKITRWELTGESYDKDANGTPAATRQMVEAFNWFSAAPPVG